VLDALESSSSALSVRLAIDVDEVKTVPDMAVVEQVSVLGAPSCVVVMVVVMAVVVSTTCSPSLPRAVPFSSCLV